MKKILILILLLVCFGAFAQKNKGKTNWVQEKNQYTARWRAGVGLDVIEPTGIDVQFYRLSKICTGDFSITKKISIGLFIGKEGLLAGNLIEKGNTSWSSGGIRYGTDLKLYIPIILNPYIGFGVEGGTRNFNGKSDFYPDGVARIGIEQKVLGIKLSSTSSLNATIFVDAKYNKCLTEDFSVYSSVFWGEASFFVNALIGY